MYQTILWFVVVFAAGYAVRDARLRRRRRKFREEWIALALRASEEGVEDSPERRLLHVVVPLLVREREDARRRGHRGVDERLRRAINAMMEDDPVHDAVTLPEAFRPAYPTVPNAE